MNKQKKYFIYNTASSVFLQVVTIAVGFILPRYFLRYYGSEVNGLISSITQFLGLISLMELGIGAVVPTALYKPLAYKDNQKVSEVICSARKFFNRIILLFSIYVIILCLVFPRINYSFDSYFSVLLIIIIATSLIAQYYFGITSQMLLAADQKAFIPSTLSVITLILNALISVILIILGYNIHFVKLFSSIVLLIKPLFLFFYVNKKYNIIKNIEYKHEPLKQKWNAAAQHIAYFVLNKTDIIVLTFFTDFFTVSIYAVHNIIVAGVNQLLTSSMSGFRPIFGYLYAKNEQDKLLKKFYQFEWLIHTIVVILFSCTAILISPFINIFTKGVIDTDYYQPVFSVVLTLATGILCLRLPYDSIYKVAGHYKETQASSIVEMSLNIGISIMLVFKWGLVGVAIGTAIAVAYRTIYLAMYIKKIINYKFRNFFKHICINSLTVLIFSFIAKYVNILESNYFDWAKSAILIFIISCTISFVVNSIFYKSQLLYVFRFITRKFVKTNKNI